VRSGRGHSGTSFLPRGIPVDVLFESSSSSSFGAEASLSMLERSVVPVSTARAALDLARASGCEVGADRGVADGNASPQARKAALEPITNAPRTIRALASKVLGPMG
jgi:hypothetical protein